MSQSDSVSPAGGLPVAPSMEPARLAARVPQDTTPVDLRIVKIGAVAVAVAVGAALAAQLLTALIAVVTNLAFYGRLSTVFRMPAENQLGALVLVVPVLGALMVGLMARYGSRAIRGHGIPEAMEQVLLNESRIPPRITFLKPLSAAIAIGTGGPFGAEGPIIATGGALGSFVGQLLRTTAVERKTLLAAGAAAGMAATFGSPISAVLLAVELLLFEFRPRSIIPVALASATATGVRLSFEGPAPVFPMPEVAWPGGGALATYVLLGALMGVVAVYVTRLVYGIEDAFERLPVHWMWWPALGAIAVGVVGYFAPRTLGVGYDNIEQFVSGELVGQAALFLCLMKLVSWSIYLGSGTSGGTLAPLFTIGGGLGSVAGGLVAAALPGLGVDARIAALVGMAAVFAGASRALLASVVFAFETTLQPAGLLPLLGGCTAAYLISSLMMRHTIMTEKIARRGVRVPSEYAADFLDQVLVRDAASRPVVSLSADEPVEGVLARLNTEADAWRHQGYPVLGEGGKLLGVVTRRDLLRAGAVSRGSVGELIHRPAAVVYEDQTLRQAADHMVAERVGRLPVVSRTEPDVVIGMITRSDLLAAHQRRLAESGKRKRSIRVRTALRDQARRLGSRIRG
ncbi:MAG: chloride channel protein [Armatimonadota bacterium]